MAVVAVNSMVSVALLRRRWAISLLALALLLGWDALGLDLPLARWFGSPQGFAWRGQPALVLLLHELPRWLSGVLLLGLLAAALRPWGGWRAWTPGERWQLVLSVASAMALVTLFKRLSYTSCPWDLAEFGGVAAYVSHWQWGLRDGGAGHCFPAGHAAVGFAYLAGWQVLRRKLPAGQAMHWLVAILLAGLVLGLSQQLRGAHYMSHTLWSAWICWTWGLGIESLRVAGVARRSARLQVRLNKV